jgi:hypothetical protein
LFTIRHPGFGSPDNGRQNSSKFIRCDSDSTCPRNDQHTFTELAVDRKVGRGNRRVRYATWLGVTRSVPYAMAVISDNKSKSNNANPVDVGPLLDLVPLSRLITTPTPDLVSRDPQKKFGGGGRELLTAYGYGVLLVRRIVADCDCTLRIRLPGKHFNRYLSVVKGRFGLTATALSIGRRHWPKTKVY